MVKSPMLSSSSWQRLLNALSFVHDFGRPLDEYFLGGFSKVDRQDLWYLASAATKSETLNSRLSMAFALSSVSHDLHNASIFTYIIVSFVPTSIQSDRPGCFSSSSQGLSQ